MVQSVVIEGALYANPQYSRCVGGRWGNNVNGTCIAWSYNFTIICVHCHQAMVQVDSNGGPLPSPLRREERYEHPTYGVPAQSVYQMGPVDAGHVAYAPHQ